MRKTNFITLVVFNIMLIFVIVFATCKNIEKEMNELVEISSESEIQKDEEIIMDATDSSVQEENDTTISDIQPASMSKSLFIGDSRTVGIMEYAGLTEANFFCNVGMNVFDIKKYCISVPTVGKVTLDELLSNKKYDRVYVMLGINELGNSLQSIVNKYNELIEFIKVKQPDAVLFVQANLHVSKKRSDSDVYINNKAINRLNLELSKLADNKNIYYIDANDLFDDKNGNLLADKTSDNVHLYAKYYVEWGKWICQETSKKLKEG